MLKDRTWLGLVRTPREMVLSWVYDILHRMQCIADMAWVIDLRCSKQGGGEVKVQGRV